MNAFTINSASLRQALAPHKGIVASNPISPILENYLLEISENILTITSSNLSLSLQTYAEVQSQQDLQLTLTAQTLDAIVAALPSQPLVFSFEPDTFACTIRTSSGGRYKIVGENPADFPMPKAPSKNLHEVEIPTEGLISAIRKTSSCTAKDQLRPAFCGIYFETDPQGLRLTATDGHRLATIGVTSEAPIPASFVMPLQAAKIIASLSANLPSVSLTYTTSFAVVSGPSFKFFVRLIDERYVDYRVALPAINPVKAIIPTADLLAITKRVMLLSDKTTNKVSLSLDSNELTLLAEDLEYSQEAADKIPVDYSGESFTVALNASLLVSLLQVAEPELTLHASAFNRPVLLKESETDLYLIMPVMPHNR